MLTNKAWSKVPNLTPVVGLSDVAIFYSNTIGCVWLHLKSVYAKKIAGVVKGPAMKNKDTPSTPEIPSI